MCKLINRKLTPKMDFSEAIKALKEGKAIQRECWTFKGMFVIKQIPCVLEGLIIDKVQSLPESAKKIIKLQDGVPRIAYTNQLLLIYGDGRADSWSPSCDDIFAEDWQILS